MSRCSIQKLSAPPGNFINGLYFRLDSDGLTTEGWARTYIASCGIIWTAKPRAAVSPVRLSALKLPRLGSLSTGCEEMHYRIGSCARLANVAKVLVFYLKDMCVGMTIYYHYGISEIVGRETPNHNTFIFRKDDPMCRIRIVRNEKSNLVKDIYFGTEESDPGAPEGKMHSVTSETVSISGNPLTD